MTEGNRVNPYDGLQVKILLDDHVRDIILSQGDVIFPLLLSYCSQDIARSSLIRIRSSLWVH